MCRRINVHKFLPETEGTSTIVMMHGPLLIYIYENTKVYQNIPYD